MVAKMNRFTDRTMTIQEAIWQQQGGQGDLEALVLWLESRLNDENRALNIRAMEETELPGLVAECLEGCQRALEVTLCLESIAKQMEGEKPS